MPNLGSLYLTYNKSFVPTTKVYDMAYEKRFLKERIEAWSSLICSQFYNRLVKRYLNAFFWTNIDRISYTLLRTLQLVTDFTTLSIATVLGNGSDDFEFRELAKLPINDSPLEILIDRSEVYVAALVAMIERIFAI